MANRKKILTIRKWIATFSSRILRLESSKLTKGRLRRIVAFWNSFEDWIKFEMADAAGRLQESEDWGDGDNVGVEYRATLTTRTKAGWPRRKLVDVWAACEPRAVRWHFVELKVAFDNSNAQKQFWSWRKDLESLRKIDRRIGEQIPASISSIMFAVGFSRKALLGRVGKATAGLGCPKPLMERLPLGDKWIDVVAIVEER